MTYRSNRDHHQPDKEQAAQTKMETSMLNTTYRYRKKKRKVRGKNNVVDVI